LLTTLLPSLNAIRAALGLAAVARISDVHDACALSLVAGPCEFEPPATVPDNVRFVGPILDAPLLTANGDDIEFEPRGLPLIVVSFSTGDQGQRDVLQRMVDALAGVPAEVVVTTGPAIDPASVRTSGNVRAVRFAPHARLLPHASLLVTHAGMGTVMAGLAHGVPLLCVPLGRDQFFNAARVESLGAGITLPADTEAPAIADAVRMLVHNAAMRTGARRRHSRHRHNAGREA
jgi:MGT family glycosyltransferase